MQMNVSLPSRMYDFVQEKVKSGMYSNASEVVRDALRELDKKQGEPDPWAKLKTNGVVSSLYTKIKLIFIFLVAD